MASKNSSVDSKKDKDFTMDAVQEDGDFFAKCLDCFKTEYR